MKESAYISIIVATRRLSEDVVSYVSQIHETLGKHLEHFEVIVVVNGLSHSKEALEVWKQYPHTTIMVELPHEHRHEVAGYIGLEYAKGDYILDIDHPTKTFSGETFLKMFELIQQGNDVVSLTPKESSSFLSRLFYRVMKHTAVVPIEFHTEYMRLVTRRALNALLKLKHRVKYRKLLYAYTGFTCTTLSVSDTEQDSNEKHKQSFFSRAELAADVFISYSTLAMRVTIGLALLFMLVSVSSGVYALGVYFLKGVHVEGWTTLLLVISFGLSGIFLLFVIIIKYLELILRESQSAPLYTVRSVQVAASNESHPHV